jgi:hypothetical protein
MALPTAGSAISLNQVNVELALTGTTAIQMNQTNVRTLFAKPSGAIAMSDGHGKSNGPPAVTSVVVSGFTGTYTPANYTTVAWTVLITYSNGTTSTNCTLLTWGQYNGTVNTGTPLVTGLKTLVVTAANVKLSTTGNVGGSTASPGYVKALDVASGVYGSILVSYACLPMYTLITMSDNTQKLMGDIVVGDTVKAIDPVTNEISNEKVTFVLDTNTSYDLIRITCENNNTIEPTPEHEVWVRRNDTTMWVEAKDVLIDDELLSVDLSYTNISTIEPIHYTQGVEVGNISVANAKVYFAERLLMHNTG